MKKIIAVSAALLMLFGLFGCAKSENVTQETTAAKAAETLEEVRLSRGTYALIDPATTAVEGFTISAKDGSWRVTLHECGSAEELTGYREFFDKNLERDDITDVVTGEKQLGKYTYDTALYTANSQYFGEYYTVFGAPVQLDGEHRLLGYSISAWMKENTGAAVDKVERIIGNIEARAGEVSDE